MPFVKIFNKGTVHRRCLEIIGIGTKQGKRDDRSIIGQFHSGFKMAIVAAMRLGLRVAVSSTDEIGPYVLDFSAKEIKFTHQGKEITAHLVCYNYSNGSTVETTIALTAFPKWTIIIGNDDKAVYPILREFVANAADEDPSYGIKFDVADIKQAPNDSTAVYIEQTPAVMEVLRYHSERYFKFFRSKPILQVEGVGAIYMKSSEKSTRFFNQGYLVDCQEDFLGEKTLYDYDAFGKDFVSEERIISSHWGYDQQLAKLFSQIRDPVILRSLIDFAVKVLMSHERDIFGYIKDIPPELQALCRQIWLEDYGENAVLACGTASTDAEVQTRGYVAVSLPREISTLFKKSGIEDSSEKVKALTKDLVERPLNEAEEKRLNGVVGRYLYPIKYYKESVDRCLVETIVDESGKHYGLTAKDFSRIFIEERRFSLKDFDLLQTLVHELRHFNTHRHDSDYREFMGRADKEIVYLLSLLKAALDKLRELGVNPHDICKDFTDEKDEIEIVEEDETKNPK